MAVEPCGTGSGCHQHGTYARCPTPTGMPVKVADERPVSHLSEPLPVDADLAQLRRISRAHGIFSLFQFPAGAVPVDQQGDYRSRPEWCLRVR